VTAIGATEVEVLVEMAPCLRELGAGPGAAVAGGADHATSGCGGT
jgi:hypothetical protein